VRRLPPIHSLVPAVVVTLACVACASSSSTPETTITTRTLSSPGNRPIETTDITGSDAVRVKGSRLDAMSALAQIYSDLEIPVAMMSPDAGQIGNQRLRLMNHRLHGRALSTYINCGQESMAGNRADMDEVTLTILSTARVDRDSVTAVSTLVQGWARPSGTSSNAVDCQSTGEIEKAIATRLQTALGVAAVVAKPN
jgi:hypothetical protein